jgi:hypothetical protein
MCGTHETSHSLKLAKSKNMPTRGGGTVESPSCLITLHVTEISQRRHSDAQCSSALSATCQSWATSWVGMLGKNAWEIFDVCSSLQDTSIC